MTQKKWSGNLNRLKKMHTLIDDGLDAKRSEEDWIVFEFPSWVLFCLEDDAAGYPFV